MCWGMFVSIHWYNNILNYLVLDTSRMSVRTLERYIIILVMGFRLARSLGSFEPDTILQMHTINAEQTTNTFVSYQGNVSQRL